MTTADMPEPRAGIFKMDSTYAYDAPHEDLTLFGCCMGVHPIHQAKPWTYAACTEMIEEFCLIMAKSFGDRSHDGPLFSTDGSIMMLTPAESHYELVKDDVKEVMEEMDGRHCDLRDKLECFHYNDFDCTDHFPSPIGMDELGEFLAENGE